MGVFNGMHENVRKTGREWAEWTRRHARDLGERGIRHLERQDLLTERKRLVTRVGSYVVERIVEDDKKSIRADAADLVDLTDRIRAIDLRLAELDAADKRNDPEDEADRPDADDVKENDHPSENGAETG